MEPRSALGEYESKTAHWTLHSSSPGRRRQSYNLLRENILNAPNEKVRVLTGNVGGSFGMKATSYPEYVCILHAAKVLGRPVKWTDERSASFVSDRHGRDYDMTVELALDEDGNSWRSALPATATSAAIAPISVRCCRRSTSARISSACTARRSSKWRPRRVLTNTTLVAAYRGAGRPEGALSMERIMDFAAAELGIDRLSCASAISSKPAKCRTRRRPRRPMTAATFPACSRPRWNNPMPNFKQRKRESKRSGKLRGIGLGCFVEATAAMTQEMGNIRFEADGSVNIITGTLDYGQGHASPSRRCWWNSSACRSSASRSMQGDSDLAASPATAPAARVRPCSSGMAIVEASDKVIEQGKMLAAHVLEASEGDIEFKSGHFTIAGTDRSIGIMELAERVRAGIKLPDGIAPTLDVTM